MAIAARKPYCSVTLSTRNKCNHLAVTLKGLAAQVTPFVYEVIVADDGSTDDTEAVCREFGVQYHYIDNDRYRNPSVARNVAFKAAAGKVIVAMCDDTVPAGTDALAELVANMRPGEFSLGRTQNWRFEDGHPVEFVLEFCGPTRPVPYFFFGALYREDLYTVGGYDEEFVEPCYDDNWFADCLMNGRKLRPRISEEVLAYHQFHDYPKQSHVDEVISKDLYHRKRLAAEHTGHWCNFNGPWPLTPREIKTRIPKVMNFFWTGNTLSWMRYMTLRSFRRYHSDWKTVLHCMSAEHASGKTWSSIEVQDNPANNGRNYMNQVAELGIEIREWTPPDDLPSPLAPSHACDLFQWALLAADGGFYADMDILFVEPLPYKAIQHANAVFCHTHEYMAIGLCAAAPGERLFSDILQSARNNYTPDGYQSTGAEAIYRLAGMLGHQVEWANPWPQWGTIPRVGPQSVNAMRRQYPATEIAVLPDATVYPWYFKQVGHIFNEDRDVPTGCCGIHWFGGDALSQTWNNKLTHENYAAYTNTFTRYAAKTLEGDAHVVDVAEP